VRKLRSTGTKVRPRVARTREPRTDAEKKLAKARRELREAVEQQAATAEVLRIIASSTGDLASVFQVILENAVRILEASFGILFRREGDLMRAVAGVGLPPKFREFHAQRGPFRPLRDLARVLRTKKPIQKADAATEMPEAPAVKFGGARTHIVVPLLKADEVVGAIIIYRQEVRPFTDKQIELVQNFAAQAVIAIENTRLLNELRESLQQQTATADVLQVISSSPGELGPVFEAMLQNATRLCEASCGTLALYDGDAFRIVALHGAPSAFSEQRHRQPVIRPDPGSSSCPSD
jgi:transcriptional regulator with GAF, ATPase, and Fis domain